MPWKGKPFGWGQPLPYINFLPETQEATVNVAYQLAERLSQEPLEGEINITLSCLEPASCQLMLQLLFKAYNSAASVSVKIESIPEPDPRRCETSYSLWRYDGTDPSPAVRAPDPAFVAACTDLALQPFSPQQNWQQAKEIAQSFQIDHIEDLLAVMVYPPPIQEGIPAWVWLPRIQLAAAQIVAALECEAGYQPEASFLNHLLRGPIDWVANAAVIALVQWIRLEDAPPLPLYQNLLHLLQRIPEDGYWSLYPVVLENVLLLPGMPDDVKSQFQDALDQFYQQETSDA